MAAKKTVGGIRSLIGKNIEYIDVRDDSTNLGVLMDVDDIGWVAIKVPSGRVLWFHAFRLDAISEKPE